MTLMMTSAQVVETSVNVTNSPSRDYSHPDDQTTQMITAIFGSDSTKLHTVRLNQGTFIMDLHQVALLWNLVYHLPLFAFSQVVVSLTLVL